MKNSITDQYRRADEHVLDRINTEAAKIAKKLKLDDRIEEISEKAAYITIKDHKEDFPGRLKFRLISPCKTNMGKISKTILERVNV